MSEQVIDHEDGDQHEEPERARRWRRRRKAMYAAALPTALGIVEIVHEVLQIIRGQ